MFDKTDFEGIDNEAPTKSDFQLKMTPDGVKSTKKIIQSFYEN